MSVGHTELVRRFFAEVDGGPPDSDTGIATCYARLFWDMRHEVLPNLPPRDAIYNIYVRGGHGPRSGGIAETIQRRQLAQSTNLEFMTKRVHLISDTVVLSDFGSGGMPAVFRDDGATYSLRCTDSDELGRWLMSCRPLLERGDLCYYPELVAERFLWMDGPDLDYWIGTSTPDRTVEDSTADLFDFIVDNGRVVEVAPEANPLSARLVFPVLEVELPYLDGTTLGDYCAIAVDETDAYAAFRDLLRAKFLDLEGAHGSEQFHRELAKIGVELRDGVRKVRADLTRVSRRRAVQVAGGALGTVSAALMAFPDSALGELLPILGASGGAWALVDAMADKLEAKAAIRSSPYYYLWLVSRKSTGA